jgi:hypothetical protein
MVLYIAAGYINPSFGEGEDIFAAKDPLTALLSSAKIPGCANKFSKSPKQHYICGYKTKEMNTTRLNPLNDFLFMKYMSEEGDGEQLLFFLNVVLHKTGNVCPGVIPPKNWSVAAIAELIDLSIEK